MVQEINGTCVLLYLSVHDLLIDSLLHLLSFAHLAWAIVVRVNAIDNEVRVGDRKLIIKLFPKL